MALSTVHDKESDQVLEIARKTPGGSVVVVDSNDVLLQQTDRSRL
jgi:hypothetical protein